MRAVLALLLHLSACAAQSASGGGKASGVNYMPVTGTVVIGVSGGSPTAPYFTFDTPLPYFRAGYRYVFSAQGIAPGYSFFVRGPSGSALDSAYGLVGGALSGASGRFSFIVPSSRPDRALVYFSPASVRMPPARARARTPVGSSAAHTTTLMSTQERASL